MIRRFAGKVALISGGGTGIGAAVEHPHHAYDLRPKTDLKANGMNDAADTVAQLKLET